jgi:hypothetical protein
VTSRRLEPGPPPERSFWDLLPRRNFRRALFLVLVLLGVLVLKRTGGLSFSRMFDGVAPAPAGGAGGAGFQHLEVKPEVKR